MDRKRETWLDGLKGFSSLLVILGHVLSGYLDANTFPDAYGSFYGLRSWIYSFHMPLFFLLSGFAFTLAYYQEGKLRREGYFRQLVQIFWLYTLFVLFQWVIKQAVPGLVNKPYTTEDLKRMYIEPLGNFWYLYVLFVFYVLAALLRLPRWPGVWLLLFGGISIVAVGCHLDEYSLTVYRIVYHLSFFLLGGYFCRNRQWLKNQKALGCACMILSSAAFFYAFFYTRTWYTNWKYPIALATCFVFLVEFYRVPKIADLPLFQLCGKYCLELYLLHTFFTGGFRSVLPLLGVTAPWLSVLLNFLLSTGLSLLLAWGAGRFWVFDGVFHPARLLRRLRTRREK